jgi:hypothetical protein
LISRPGECPWDALDILQRDRPLGLKSLRLRFSSTVISITQEKPRQLLYVKVAASSGSIHQWDMLMKMKGASIAVRLGGMLRQVLGPLTHPFEPPAEMKVKIEENS